MNEDTYLDFCLNNNYINETDKDNILKLSNNIELHEYNNIFSADDLKYNKGIRFYFFKTS